MPRAVLSSSLSDIIVDLVQCSADPAPRWVCPSGKLDRCQLGHSDQLNQVQALQQTISNVVRDMGIQVNQKNLCIADEPADPSLCSSVLLALCRHISKQAQLTDEIITEAKTRLLEVALVNPVVGAILTQHGYTSKSKYPEQFDFHRVCELTYCSLTGLLEELLEALRTVCAQPVVGQLLWLFHVLYFCSIATVPEPRGESAVTAIDRRGNSVCIRDASRLAWKSELEVSICEDHKFTKVFQDVMEKDDIFDAMMHVTELQREVANVRKEHPAPKLIRGPRPCPEKIEERQQVKKVKYAVEALAKAGVEHAGKAAEKLDSLQKRKSAEIDEDCPEEPGDAEGKRKKKREKRRKRMPPRAPQSKCRYSREAGDELRLIRKREIVPRTFLLFAGGLLQVLWP